MLSDNGLQATTLAQLASLLAHDLAVVSVAGHEPNHSAIVPCGRIINLQWHSMAPCTDDAVAGRRPQVLDETVLKGMCLV